MKVLVLYLVGGPLKQYAHFFSTWLIRTITSAFATMRCLDDERWFMGVSFRSKINAVLRRVKQYRTAFTVGGTQLPPNNT